MLVPTVLLVVCLISMQTDNFLVSEFNVFG